MGEGFKKIPHLSAKFLCSIMTRGDFSGMTDWLGMQSAFKCEVLCPWNDGHAHKESVPWDLGSHRFPRTAARRLEEFAALW